MPEVWLSSPQIRAAGTPVLSGGRDSLPAPVPAEPGCPTQCWDDSVTRLGREHRRPRSPDAAVVRRVAPRWAPRKVQRRSNSPTRVTGRVHSHCSGAIPGTETFLVSGAPRPPAGLSGAAPSARGPGEEPARGPGKQTHSCGRGRRYGRPPAPPRRARRPQCRGEDHCLG
ncbi:hypothetical protein NDU88_004838 [Pleurodeles waltl]|uniref:Uncharacterized protein n=1 Tax=Pleurodeles waltl TaxID=8319 RepID=A0AAV7UGB9_PLEWA|nr:hypothetical protein NDU88_004838 [Pleurodeles waltl]